MDPDFFTPRQMADKLQVSLRALVNWRTNGGGPPWIKAGGRIRYPRTSFEAWVESQSKEQNDGRKS